MNVSRRLLPMALAACLSACATAPVSKTAPESAVTPSKIPAPPVTPANAAPPAAAPAPPDANVWDQLRSRFAMSDCDADPGIMLWARRYTQNPQRFETQMQEALPQVIFVQQVAAKYDVAGEFVLLPWVESQFKSIPGQRNRPAGMWQIVPSTGHTLGLHMSHGYDGRLDTPAATESVMQLLSKYHNDLHDWRLVDYAYNSGEFGLQKVVAHYGAPPEEPAIPKLPVSRITREHLTKLLAIACVVRDPGRFNVDLPMLPPEEHLEKVPVTASMSITDAAGHAGMPADALAKINPALHDGKVDATTSNYLLMPHRNAEQWRSTRNAQKLDDQGLTAEVIATPTLPALPNDGSQPAVQPENTAPPAVSKAVRTHVVRSGETLWEIARRYSVNIKTLQRWNHLSKTALKPGQVLRLDGPG